MQNVLLGILHFSFSISHFSFAPLTDVTLSPETGIATAPNLCSCHCLATGHTT